MKGALSLDKKTSLCAPQRHKLRGDSKYYRLEFPHFEMCPKYCQLQSYWFFLLFLEDVLYCIQIHIWKRLPQAKSNFVVAFWLLGPKEGILHTQPTNLRSPDTHVESGWKTWPKGLTHKSDHYGPFFLLNTHTKNGKQIRPAKCYHGISQDGFPTRSKQFTLHKEICCMSDNAILYAAGSVRSKTNPARVNQHD